MFKSTVALILILATLSASTSDIINSWDLVKLKIPVKEYDSYLSQLQKIKPIVKEVIESQLGHAASSYIYEDWIIDSNDRETINQALDEIKSHQIEYKLIPEADKLNTIARKSKIKRDLSNYPRREFNNHTINSTNIVQSYYSVDQVHDWMRRMNSEYPNITEIINIGKSIQNRDLLVIRLGYPSSEKKRYFWFDSGIHAREWTTINTAMYTVDQILKEQSVENSMMNRLLKRHDLFFLLIANPDGYQYSLNYNGLWRKNMRDFAGEVDDDCFGVDLNRNFNYHWMKTGASMNVCEEVYAGEKESSEPESKAIQQFVMSKKSRWLSFISIHSYGALWLHHWEKNHPSLTKNTFVKICNKPVHALKTLNKKMGYDFLFGVPNQLLDYDAGGASDAWAMMMANVSYAYTLEVGPNERESYNDISFALGFNVNESKISYVVLRAYTALQAYFHSFVYRQNKGDRLLNERQCLNDYSRLVNGLSGYWNENLHEERSQII